MKKLLIAAILVLLSTAVVWAQTQGTSQMLNWKHDFRVTSTKATAAQISGASASLCGYCHAPHIPTGGIMKPLWIRTAAADKNWGRYESSTMDATMVDPSVSTGNQHHNVSNMCMSCHDGSSMYVAAAYAGGKRPFAGATPWTTFQNRTVQDAGTAGRDRNRLVGGTAYTSLAHTHPVNFDYDAALIAADGGLYAPLGTYGTSGKYMMDMDGIRYGRLFDGKMQCSSCHNPHLPSTKMVQGSTDDGKLCVSCHKK